MKIWYDSDCGVCTEFVVYITGKINSPEVVFISNSCNDSVPKSLGLKKFEALKNTTIICEDDDGTVYTHHRAMAKILNRAGMGYRLVSKIITFPIISIFFYVGYRIFSRFRHKVSSLFGLNECKIENPYNF